eukprot:5339596-Amphidinium_carterae.1
MLGSLVHLLLAGDVGHICVITASTSRAIALDQCRFLVHSRVNRDELVEGCTLWHSSATRG